MLACAVEGRRLGAWPRVFATALRSPKGQPTLAVVIDAPVGKGHVVLFATRPYWRWQTQGLFFLGFNAILNWNDLDAGKEPPKEGAKPGGEQ